MRHLIPLTFLALCGCTTINVNYSKNVGQGCTSSAVTTAQRDTGASGGANLLTQEGAADFARAFASSLATDDDCSPEAP